MLKKNLGVEIIRDGENLILSTGTPELKISRPPLVKHPRSITTVGKYDDVNFESTFMFFSSYLLIESYAIDCAYSTDGPDGLV